MVYKGDDMKKIGFPKVRKVKKLSVKGAKTRAWKVFSLWIRLSNAKDNMVSCYTCGSIYPALGNKERHGIQAGHGIGGRNNAILFSEELVRPQCIICNRFKRGNYSVFTKKLIEELGLERYGELVILSNQVVKLSVQDYQAVCEKYKSKLEEFSYRI